MSISSSSLTAAAKSSSSSINGSTISSSSSSERSSVGGGTGFRVVDLISVPCSSSPLVASLLLEDDVAPICWCKAKRAWIFWSSLNTGQQAGFRIRLLLHLAMFAILCLCKRSQSRLWLSSSTTTTPDEPEAEGDLLAGPVLSMIPLWQSWCGTLGESFFLGRRLPTFLVLVVVGCFPFGITMGSGCTLSPFRSPRDFLGRDQTKGAAF